MEFPGDGSTSSPAAHDGTSPDPPDHGSRRMHRSQHVARAAGPGECVALHATHEDRQKTLAVHGVLMSDERLPVTVLDYRDLKSVEGRVLVHGERRLGENGRSYLMLEGTDARVHHIYYTAEMEEARSRGGLRTNSFVRLRKRSIGGEPVMEIDELGNSDAILRNDSYLKRTAQALIKRGIIPDENGWGGWLGRYQAALRQAVLKEFDLERQSCAAQFKRTGGRSKER